MFRPTSVLALAGAVIAGIIIADLLIHPEGTKAIGNSLVSIERPTYNALLGVPS
jgi:hypothetical protein